MRTQYTALDDNLVSCALDKNEYTAFGKNQHTALDKNGWYTTLDKNWYTALDKDQHTALDIIKKWYTSTTMDKNWYTAKKRKELMNQYSALGKTVEEMIQCNDLGRRRSRKN